MRDARYERRIVSRSLVPGGGSGRGFAFYCRLECGHDVRREESKLPKTNRVLCRECQREAA